MSDFFLSSAMKSLEEKGSIWRIEEVRSLVQNSFYGAVIQFIV